MSKYLKILVVLMMWVVITSDIASPNPASAQTSAPEDDGVKNYYENFADAGIRPAPRISPPVGAQQVVGLETWLAIDEEQAWHTISWYNGDLKYEARPVNTIWTFSDQAIICDGPGVEYTEGAEGPAPCGRTWNHTTEVADMTMEVAIEYEITWTEVLEDGGDGESGMYVQKGHSLDTYNLRIGEIQSIGTQANIDYSNSGGTFDDFRSEQDGISSKQGYDDDNNECGLFQVVCDIGEDVAEGLTEIVNLAAEFAGFVIKTLMQGISWLRSILPDSAKQILDFLEGCVEQFDEIVEVLLTSALSMIDDSLAYLNAVFADISLAVEAFQKDPIEFAKQLAAETTGAEDAEQDMATWAGSWVCEYALNAASGTIPTGIRHWLSGLAYDATDTSTTRPTRPADE